MSQRDLERETRILRTAADTAALLLELERGMKAFQYYPAASRERADHLDRCFRAWSDDLARFGPLCLEVRGTAFWYGEPPIPVGAGRCEELARNFTLHSLWHLVFEPSLSVEDLASLLETLCTHPSTLEATALPAPTPLAGVQLPDPSAPAEQKPTTVREPPSPSPLLDDGTDDPTPDDTAPHLEVDPDFEITDPESTLAGTAPLGAPRKRAAAAAPAHEAPRLEVRALLDELEDCDDDESYREVGFQLAALIEVRVQSGFRDEGYGALLAFARHASDDQKRSVEQRYVAEHAVNRICEGPLLDLLIERACSPEADTALRASETLLVLGSTAVPPLLERLSREQDRVTRGRLSSVVLAMGEEAATALLPELESGDPVRRQVALRLSGETQNPRLVGALRRIFLRSDGDAARESAKALVQIGDVAAYEALIEGLQNPRPEVVRLSIYSLGRTGRSLFVAPLVGALHRALDVDALDLAREVIRALGRLGHPEAVAEIGGILRRGGWFQRRRFRELKMAAVAALRALPGEEAEAELRRTLRQRDRVLRDAARSALLHRGSAPR